MGPWQLLLRPVSAAVSSSTQIAPKCLNHCSFPHLSVSFLGCVRSFSRSTNNNLEFRIAASFSGKGRKFDSQKNVDDFRSLKPPAVRHRPGRAPRPASGQDSFFVAEIAGTKDVAFGVADGVGGWADSGVDPADFSHGFCQFMAHTVAHYSSEKRLKPREIMQLGYEKIVKDGSVKAGGSTACIAVARADGILEVANLGDSGFVQLRLNAVRYASDPQTHAFNTPFQLSIIPQKMLAQEAYFGGHRLHDMPRDSVVTNHTIKNGDVLVFASDGVWDNLSPQDILKIVSGRMRTLNAWKLENDAIVLGDGIFDLTDFDTSKVQGIDTLQSLLAASIAGEAKIASLDTKRNGPFAREVQKYYPGEGWHGGKPDDICVIVVLVIS
ncbi:MAG: hypothetical protein M1814_000802 [Vezdaea aestivalis]|nr:MAG: hypothetical protein M1814_000802 [Vezdaea aestivalis]